MIFLPGRKPKAKPVKKRDGRRGGESLHLAIDGAPVAVKLRLNPRARRVIVKVDPGTGDVTVVAPSRTGLKHALDFARGEQDWIAQWLEAKAAASDAMIATGATITHHHAVGRDHKPWLAEEIGPVGVEILRAVKERVDPAGVMNPGVLVP